jgi:benzoyl-CoA 2,3-dioxygenase component B
MLAGRTMFVGTGRHAGGGGDRQPWRAGIEDPTIPRRCGSWAIDLPAIQRKVNLHYSLTLDLFGSEESTNAANFFNAGLKGRFHEDRLDDDHRLRDATYPVMKLVDGELKSVAVPALNGLNARLRDDFMEDCLGGIRRWNREIATHDVDFEITLPHVAFNRVIGEF